MMAVSEHPNDKSDIMERRDRHLKDCIAIALAWLLFLGNLQSVTAAETVAEPAEAVAEPAETVAEPAETDAEAAVHRNDSVNERVFPRLPGYALIGTGGLMLLTAIITGSMALKLNSDLKDDCPGGACFEPHHDDVDRLDALAAVTDVFLPLGAVLIISGSFLYVFSRKTEQRYGDGNNNRENGSRRPSASSGIPTFSGNALVWRF